MSRPNDLSEDLTPAERRHEIAALLARGILRLGDSLPKGPEYTESRLTEDPLEERGERP